MNLPKQVIIMDVSPRDGLQSEPVFVPTEQKIQLIESLISAGVRKIEATSFVSPKWAPQMADAEAVLQAVVEKHPDVTFEVLLPNEKGYDRAKATGLFQKNGALNRAQMKSRSSIRSDARCPTMFMTFFQRSKDEINSGNRLDVCFGR